MCWIRVGPAFGLRVDSPWGILLWICIGRRKVRLFGRSRIAGVHWLFIARFAPQTNPHHQAVIVEVARGILKVGLTPTEKQPNY
jgi:hypothetical protein